MAKTISPNQLVEQREINYHRTPAQRLINIEAARAFVDDVGFCHFWPIKDAELPNLFHAIAGQVRAVPDAHDDPDGSKCWGWKDQSLGKKWWYYGKFLCRRATLVSLELLPVFYASSENFGGVDEYLTEYRDGLMTAEAKDIYEALLDNGPLDTVRLRKEARMSADSAKARFERALVELQVGLKVIPVGIAETGAWRYSFIYELLQRHYPEVPEQAQHIGRFQAQCKLVQQYLDNVVAGDCAMVSKIFHILKWTRSELDDVIKALLKADTIAEISLQGSGRTQLVATRWLDRDEM